MMEEIDLGVCPARLWHGAGDRVAVVLPGARYLPGYPLLWFSRKALQQEGWTVIEVWDEWKDGDARKWVEERARAALDRAPKEAQTLVVAKSISTHAASLVAERGIPAVWLTPLLKDEEIVAALRRAPAPALLIGGSADPDAWDLAAAASISGGEVLEIAAADHSLEIPGHALASIDALREVASAIHWFVVRQEDAGLG